MSTQIAETQNKGRLVARMAARFGVDETKLLSTLKNTAFRVKEGEVTNEQMMALMVVADQYGLNPFTREIYAFPDKQNGIVPVVGVDGWSRIINQHPQLDGIEFRYSDELVEPGDERFPGLKHAAHEWIECVIHRKDRDHPTSVREYLDEVYRPPFTGTGKNGKYTIENAWQTHTRRFHRHKALIQCSRIAFGFAGIFDEDEAGRILEARRAEDGVYEVKKGKPEVAAPQRRSKQPAKCDGNHGGPPCADPECWAREENEGAPHVDPETGEVVDEDFLRDMDKADDRQEPPAS